MERSVTAGVRLGLLHTVPDLAGRFETLAGELAPGSQLVHLTDPGLLASAIADGVTEELRDRVAAHVGYLAGSDLDAVLVTCSSIGECADAAARTAGAPVLRVDRPMAREAVSIAALGSGRIAVLATLASTLGPTERLVQAETARNATPIVVDTALVDGAAAARSAGDVAGHDALVAAAVQRAASDADVVVLAQASMADAVPASPASPVLSSPLSGLQAALAAARRHR